MGRGRGESDNLFDSVGVYGGALFLWVEKL